MNAEIYGYQVRTWSPSLKRDIGATTVDTEAEARRIKGDDMYTHIYPMYKLPVEEIKRRIETLSGSGFDCHWEFEDKGKFVECTTDWHLMDSHGYYAGYYGFTVYVPVNDIDRFKIRAHKGCKRVFNRHGIMEYLYQSVDYALAGAS